MEPTTVIIEVEEEKTNIEIIPGDIEPGYVIEGLVATAKTLIENYYIGEEEKLIEYLHHLIDREIPTEKINVN